MDQAGQVSFKQLVKNKQFLALWLSHLVSNFGDWLALIALFDKKKGTPYEVSGIMISFIIPMAFLGPVVGDFKRRSRAKRTGQGGLGAAAAILFFCLAFRRR